MDDAIPREARRRLDERSDSWSYHGARLPRGLYAGWLWQESRDKECVESARPAERTDTGAANGCNRTLRADDNLPIMR